MRSGDLGVRILDPDGHRLGTQPIARGQIRGLHAR
jgi:hypothetical protein